MASDAEFCWRVHDAPASLDETVALGRPTTAFAACCGARSRTSRKLGKPSRAALAAALAGAVAFMCVTAAGRSTREARPFLQEIDRLAELAGFGLHQVSITGHRLTSDAAIFDAFDLVNVRSLLRFDSVGVRERIEQLPSVDSASVTWVMPDQVSVQIVERTPFAVWQRAGRTVLIDATGRVLAPADGLHRDLPRVAGEGASATAAEILALARSYPDLLQRLDMAVRVGERRWTLRLTGGPDVHLPAGGVPQALARLMAANAQGRLVDPSYAVIDMRSDKTIAVRRTLSDEQGGGEQPRGEQSVPSHLTTSLAHLD
jgi:cell division protein FtsQ